MKSAGFHVSHSSHPSRRPFVALNVVKGVRTTATNARMSATTVRNESNTESCSKRMAVISIAGLFAFSKGARAEEGNSAVESPGRFTDQRKKAREQAEKNDADFASSEFLKGLRDKSDLNKARYRKELQDRYCYRQAELGVGDCGGLQLIPGATKAGKQKTPEWLKGVLQKLGQLPPDEAVPAATSK